MPPKQPKQLAKHLIMFWAQKPKTAAHQEPKTENRGKRDYHNTNYVNCHAKDFGKYLVANCSSHFVAAFWDCQTFAGPTCTLTCRFI